MLTVRTVAPQRREPSSSLPPPFKRFDEKRNLDVVYNPTSVTLVFDGLLGDYNGDGTVDAADYVLTAGIFCGSLGCRLMRPEGPFLPWPCQPAIRAATDTRQIHVSWLCRSRRGRIVIIN
jgi:hypothetical protein